MREVYAVGADSGGRRDGGAAASETVGVGVGQNGKADLSEMSGGAQMSLTRIAVLSVAAALVLVAWLARAQGPGAIVQYTGWGERLDVFQTASQTFTLSGVPAPAPTPRVMVFFNGMLMLQGTDYTLSGAALTFTGANVAADPNPVVQVAYRVAQ
jgi:hypothetical protein